MSEQSLNIDTTEFCPSLSSFIDTLRTDFHEENTLNIKDNDIGQLLLEISTETGDIDFSPFLTHMYNEGLLITQFDFYPSTLTAFVKIIDPTIDSTPLPNISNTTDNFIEELESHNYDIDQSQLTENSVKFNHHTITNKNISVGKIFQIAEKHNQKILNFTACPTNEETYTLPLIKGEIVPRSEVQ